jgi:Trypsin-like peptidase domain
MKVETAIEQLLFSTILIATTKPLGPATGTGFLFEYEDGDKKFPFIVTNKHVVDNATAGRMFFTLSDDSQPFIGQRVDVEFTDFQTLWHGHPNPLIDIAIAPFGQVFHSLCNAGKKPFIRTIPQSLTLESVGTDDVDAMEEVIFIGYPNGIYDKVNLLPIIRRGTTATPLQLDYNGRPTFLIDASVFGGSSGSPVFLYSPGGRVDRYRRMNVNAKVIFLGILAEVHIREEYNPLELITITSTNVPVTKVTQMLDLGIVFKARAIVEVVKEWLIKNGQVSP